jgi:hypothetical protein
MRRVLFLGLLLAVVSAPTAFGCAQCKIDSSNCWFCPETWNDGGQKCIVNDWVGCQEQGQCTGIAGEEYCNGSPCSPYIIITEARPPANGWQVASVTFVPPRAKAKARHA